MIDKAVKKLKLGKTPSGIKKGRGRKATRPDIYVKVSQAQISDLAKRIKEGKGTLSSGELRRLRNKKSALQCRVNQKLDRESLLQELKNFKTKFFRLAQKIAEEVTNSTCMHLLQIISKMHSSEGHTIKK